jgi:archaellin
VSERIEVTSSVGIVNSDTSTLSEIRVTTTGAPGADDIDLTDTTIQAVGPGGQENLVFADRAFVVNVPSTDDQIDLQDTVPDDAQTIQVGVGTLTSPDSNSLTIDDGAAGNSITIDGTELDQNEINEIDVSELDLQSGNDLTVDYASGGSTETVAISQVEATVGSIAPSSDDVVLQTPIRPNDGEIEVGVTSSTAGATDLVLYEQSNTSNSVSTTIQDDASQNVVTVDISGLGLESGDTLEATLGDGISAGDTGAASDTVTLSASLGINQVQNLNPGEFAVGSDGAFLSDPVLDDQNQYTILLNPTSGAFADEEAFGESDDATLDLVSPAGATTQVELTAPDLFSEQGEAVRL